MVMTGENRARFSAPLSVKRFVFVSTLLGVFSQALNINVGSTIFFFYFVMLGNLLLIWTFLRPLILPKWLGWFLLFLLTSGLIGLIRGTDTFALIAKQEIAIALSLFYFVNFFRLQGNSVDESWRMYAKLAYWLTLVGLVMWPVQCWIGHGFVRMHGIASEPSTYCILTLPAYYWYAHQWVSNGTHRKEVLWITLGVALSGSSTGYMAVLFGLLLLFSRRLTTALIATVLACGLGVTLYFLSPDVRLRVDDTSAALSDSNVSPSNLSTYALISNMFVTERVFEEHPLLGNGLGSHILSNQKYIESVPGQELVEAAGWGSGANVQDASSLALRSISELGLAGFIGILYFIVHFHVGGTGYRAGISSAILTVFFQKILRNGGYSSPEQFFFVMVYILNCQQYRRAANKSVRATYPRKPPPVTAGVVS